MTRSIRFTPPARAQFLAALAYIKADRPMAAADFKQLAIESLARLVEFPESGRVAPEFPQLGFREVLVGPYRFFFRESGDAIWVVGVWHDAQIPDEPSDASGA